MKVVKIKKLGKLPVYDLSVDVEENYVLENGVVTHNTGALYSANNIFFISKSQEKDGKEFIGSKFTLIAEKSRTIKERSKIPVTVTFEDGVDVFSGVVEWAMEYGNIVKPKNGWYAIVDMESGEVQEPNLRLKEINTAKHLIPLLKQKPFQEFVKEKYLLAKDDFKLVDDVINMEDLD